MRSWTLILTLFFVVAVSCSGQDEDLIFQSRRRNGASLKGAWLAVYDMRARPIGNTLRSLKNSGITTVYMDVWHHGKVVFRSKTVEKLTGESLDPQQDLLETALREAANLGLEIVAWFSYGLAVHHKSIGSMSKLASIALETKLTSGWANDFLWLDANNMKSIDLLGKMMVDCVELYNSKGLAGIQLDDHFAFPNGLAKSNEKALNVAVKYYKEILTRAGLKRFSLSPNNLPWARRLQRQNWAMWLNIGWIDEVIVQNYFVNPKDFKKTFDAVVRSVKPAKRKQLGIGIPLSTSAVPVVSWNIASNYIRMVAANRALKGLVLWHSPVIVNNYSGRLSNILRQIR